MANTITFRPTEEQGGFIDRLIESGDFANQSEVIRAGIRLLRSRNSRQNRSSFNCDS
jgi:antitoxin ParD1/3/4